MKIEDLLKIKLKQDLLTELKTKNDFNFSEDKYIEICTQIIDLKLKYIKFLYNENKCKYSSEDRCCARIWDNHYGTRCRYKKNKTDYCNHHNSMIKRSGKLYLNRYDEDKPIFNEKGNRFPWLVDSNIEILNNIILNQENKLKKLINKDRQITPKI